MEIAVFSPEMNVALAAQVVALVSALFILYQASLTRVHNRLSVRPHLGVEVCGDQTSVEWRISNFGLGPALVKTHGIYFDENFIGSTEDITRCRTAIQYAVQSIGNYSSQSSVFSNGTAIIPGSHRILIKFIYNDGRGLNSGEFSEKYHAEITRFDSEIDYECMYGFKYKLDTRLISPSERT